MKKLFIALATAIAAVVTGFADVTVASAGGAITVTVAAGTVEESAPVYLVWDTTDQGDDFAAWTNKAELGDVTAAGDTFNVAGATYSIPDGANIRAFVMDGDKVDLYASLKKPKSVSGLVDLGYSPGKAAGTSGVDIDFKFENLSTESGVTYIFFGICDYSSQAASEAGNTWGENFHIACAASQGNSRWIIPLPHANDHKNYKDTSYTINPPSVQTLATRHVLRTRTGEVPRLLQDGVTAYSAPSSWPAKLTWDYAPGTVAVFGRNDNPPKAESPRYFKYGDMTLYGLRIYEKPESAHVCVRDYVPAEKDGTKGLYETISGGFYPVSADGFTLGGSATNSIFQSGAASSAATYEGGDTPEPTDMSVSVTDWKGTYDGAAHSATVTVTDPATGYTIMWDNSSTGATGPAYTDAGFYTNTFTVSATGYNNFVGTGVVEIASAPTPPEPPTGDVEVSSADGEITVTVAANTVAESSAVYLVWDTTDKGGDLADWANKAKIGDVTAAGQVFKVRGATLAIPAGAVIRAFVGANITLYTAVDYLQSSDGAYIDTGLALTQADKMTCDFSFVDQASASAYWWIAGSRKSSTDSSFVCFVQNGDDANHLKVFVDYSSYQKGRASSTAGNLGTQLVVGNRYTVVNCSTERSVTPADTSAPLLKDDVSISDKFTTYGNAYLFYVSAPGGLPTGSTVFTGRIYSYKVERGDKVMQDLVPALNGSGVACMFDKASGDYLVAATGTFAYGGTPHVVSISDPDMPHEIASGTAIYEDGEIIPMTVQMTDDAGAAFDGVVHSVGLTVTCPESADMYEAAWDWDDGLGYAHDAPGRYYVVGTYTNRVKLTAAGFNDFYGTGVVTIAEGTVPTGAYVDFAHEGGPVKPVNGVCGVPMEVLGWLQTWEAFPALKDAGIPCVRLHDMQLMTSSRRGLFIDIPNIFPVFTNDVEQAANYRFGFSDNLIARLYRDIGMQPIFRLGVSREEFVAKGLPPLSARKPADALKWAKICEKIILHYTQNWNNKGFNFDIPYWEIWSSPDDHPNTSSNVLWNASFDDYKTFYGTVATYLKDKFPNLKFGGYTMSDVAALSRGDTSELATYRRTCAESFLAAARDNGWPLDFFSYRMTGDIAGVPADIAAVNSFLDSYGFTREKTQRFCAEWLPAPTEEKLGSAQQIAEIAAGLAALQQGPCDFACLYSALNVQSMYAPLFKQVNPETPRPAINCFKAYHELRKLGTAVQVRNLPAGVFATGASDGGGGIKLLIANVSGADWTPTLAFAPWTVVSAVNVSNWQTANMPASLPNNSVWLLTLGLNN